MVLGKHLCHQRRNVVIGRQRPYPAARGGWLRSHGWSRGQCGSSRSSRTPAHVQSSGAAAHTPSLAVSSSLKPSSPARHGRPPCPQLGKSAHAWGFGGHRVGPAVGSSPCPSSTALSLLQGARQPWPLSLWSTRKYQDVQI